MITLEVADLVVIAGRVLEVDTAAALDLLDLSAAEAALTAVTPAHGRDGPAGEVAALLYALVRHQPLRRGNTPVALAAALQFLALNGWQADLDPPEATTVVLAELTAGTLGQTALADWLAPRLRPCDNSEPCAKETPMRRWLPGRKRPAQPKAKFERFTVRARQVVALSQEEARRLHHNYIGTEHLLLGLIREGDGIAAKALTGLGVSLQAVRAQVEEIIGQGTSVPPAHIPFTPRAKKVLELSLREALQLGHTYIGTEHILLGLIREGEGVAAQVLVTLGADHARLKEEVLRLLAENPPTSHGGGGRPDLDRYDEQLAKVRSVKEAAVDAQDFDIAAALRVAEKQLLDKRAQRERERTAGTDVDVLIEENRRLHQQVERLQDLLRQHGIEPDGGASHTA